MSRREARLDRDVAALLAARAFTEIRYPGRERPAEVGGQLR